jgi:hypothetical protein
MAFVPLQSISGWTAGGPIDMAHGFVLASLLFPVMVLVHEAGHATVGLLRTEGLVVLRVGRSPGWVRGRFGRLAFEVSPIPSQNKIAGSATTIARMTRGESIAYAVAGSAAQLAVLVVAVPLIAQTSGAVHAALVWAWVLYFLESGLNLVPRRIGGYGNDGMRLFTVIRSNPVGVLHPPLPKTTVDDFLNEFSDTQSRWVVLITNGKAPFRTQRRVATLVGAAWAIGLQREKSPEVGSAFWHALAGWCWRECERGDPERSRAAVERAWRRTAQGGLVGRELDATVAAALAADPDLALGSPGRTDDERRGFLALAFKKLQPPADCRALDEQDRLFCFRYGVALHDVEALADGRP